MDRKEKRRLKEVISKHIDLSNGRYTDYEVTQLHDLVENRDSYDGHSQSYHRTYKTFDSEDTYRVEDTNTYTFRSDDTGIHVDHEHTSDWDDGQHDASSEILRTGREILNVLGKLRIKR